MTNSCVSSKWLPHIQTGNYGMSQNCIDESKQYIFVKLTDSAYRAVEEYQKNETKCSARAKIQVVGNGGVISFPTADESEGQKFEFAIDDIEGSFECIKQTQNDLDVLGTLPYKMRIQANDDVYEKTRHRMAVAEETQKNKCTREIKPNQTDIGRKVKLKNSIGSSSGSSGGVRESGSNNSNGNINSNNSGSGNGGRNGIIGGANSSSNGSVLPKRELTASNCSPINNNNSNSNINNNNNNSNSGIISSSSTINNHPLKTSSNSRSPNPSMSSSRSSNNNNNNNNNSQNNSNLVGMPTSASSLSSALSSAAGSGTSGISNGYFRGNSPEMKINSSNNKNGPNLAGNNRAKGKAGLGNSNAPGIGQNSTNNRHKGNDITKRNIRERLIHLLALKPFKKPELYSRLQNEGIRDREKSLISTILKEISTMRDNTYNLKRPMWNDVNENWQFYTEQELQMLKRRKPQNLTPPLSSDAGSSTSGQSPTSTHNGSPPPAVKRPPSLDHRDRGYDDPMAKKPRISHFKKDTASANSNNSGGNAAGLLLGGPSGGGGGSDKNQNMMNNQNHIDTDENSVDLSYSVLDSDEFRTAGLVSNSRRSAGVAGGGGGGGGGGGAQTTSGGLKIYHNNNNKSPYSETGVIGKNSTSHYSSSAGGGGGGGGRQQTASPSTLSSSNNNNNKQSVIYSPSQQQQQLQQQQQPQQASSTTPATNHRKSQQKQSQYQQQQQQQQQQPQQHHHQQSLHYQQQQAPPPPLQQQLQPQPRQQPQLQQQQQHNPQRHTQLLQNQPPAQPRQSQPQPPYDFSKYTKITTIEQRRHYKTEFERDFAEYRQLLSQIENVGKRFQRLADRLHNARNDADYSNIKKQIVNEYETIRHESAHQRDKMRFDYLHVKLAHIKGLVSDYDKLLTSQGAAHQQSTTSGGSPDPAGVAVPPQHQQQHQQHLSNGTEPSSGYFPRSKMYMTPSPPQRIDGVAGGGGAGGVLENGPAIHHQQQQQQSHHMMANDDDAY